MVDIWDNSGNRLVKILSSIYVSERSSLPTKKHGWNEENLRIVFCGEQIPKYDDIEKKLRKKDIYDLIYQIIKDNNETTLNIRNLSKRQLIDVFLDLLKMYYTKTSNCNNVENKSKIIDDVICLSLLQKKEFLRHPRPKRKKRKIDNDSNTREKYPYYDQFTSDVSLGNVVDIERESLELSVIVRGENSNSMNEENNEFLIENEVNPIIVDDNDEINNSDNQGQPNDVDLDIFVRGEEQQYENNIREECELINIPHSGGDDDHDNNVDIPQENVCVINDTDLSISQCMEVYSSCFHNEEEPSSVLNFDNIYDTHLTNETEDIITLSNDVLLEEKSNDQSLRCLKPMEDLLSSNIKKLKIFQVIINNRVFGDCYEEYLKKQFGEEDYNEYHLKFIFRNDLHWSNLIGFYEPFQSARMVGAKKVENQNSSVFLYHNNRNSYFHNIHMNKKKTEKYILPKENNSSRLIKIDLINCYNMPENTNLLLFGKEIISISLHGKNGREVFTYHQFGVSNDGYPIIMGSQNAFSLLIPNTTLLKFVDHRKVCDFVINICFTSDYLDNQKFLDVSIVLSTVQYSIDFHEYTSKPLCDIKEKIPMFDVFDIVKRLSELSSFSKEWEVSNKCPIGMNKIKVHSLTKNCKHLQTMELKNLLKVAQSHIGCRCPYCNIHFEYNEIFIVSFSSSIMNSDIHNSNSIFYENQWFPDDDCDDEFKKILIKKHDHNNTLIWEFGKDKSILLENE